MNLLRRSFLKLAEPWSPRRPFRHGYRLRTTRAGRCTSSRLCRRGGVDITARLIGQWLGERLGSPSSPKPAGRRRQYRHRGRRACGARRLHAAVSTVPNAVNATLYPDLGFSFIRDIAPVAGIIRVPMVILVHPSVPAGTVPN